MQRSGFCLNWFCFMSQTTRLIIITLMWLYVFLSGCSSVTEIASDQLLSPLIAPASTIIEPGPFLVDLSVGKHVGEYGCTLSYETYKPIQKQSETMVLLAHGFKRSLKSMRGWAKHWASYGVSVTAMSLCNSSWFSGKHDRNAADMIALADAIHNGPLLYAGFSAGGISAYLAAIKDSNSIAYLGLDSVDSGGHIDAQTAKFDNPALFLLAEPSACNASNNILSVVSISENPIVLRIIHSKHCHFENPYDARCELACGSLKPQEATDITIHTIQSLATAWVLKHTLNDPTSSRILDSALAVTTDWRERIEILHTMN